MEGFKKYMIRDSYISTIQNKRETNEDRVIIFPLLDNKLEICFVIDGCGHANAVGDVVVKHLLTALSVMTELDLQQLEALVIELNNRIYECRKLLN